MEKGFDANFTEFQRELFDFVQDKLEDDMSAAAISSILVLHGTKIGLDIGVDPRVVAVNALSSVSKCLSDDFDEQREDQEGIDDEGTIDHECDGNVIYLNGEKVLH